ncbi:MAG: DUF445 domain-containing protein [Chitinophagaceae bacterium]
MSWTLYFTPFIAAAMGWLLVALALKFLFHPRYPRKFAGIRFQGIIPARQQEMAVKLGTLCAEWFSVQEIQAKITNPENVKKIMPQAEAHIDHFLRVKLVKSMPVVGMFVGDKTINNLKALFVTELEQLFPEIMSNYMHNLEEDFNIREMVTMKIAGIDPAVIEKAFLEVMRRQLFLTKGLGALLGVLIGLLQLCMLLLLR